MRSSSIFASLSSMALLVYSLGYGLNLGLHTILKSFSEIVVLTYWRRTIQSNSLEPVITFMEWEDADITLAFKSVPLNSSKRY